MKLSRPLRGSETGADVRMVQRALNKWATGKYVDIPVNGRFDYRTSDRLMAFQAEQKIKPASGLFGQKSLDHLWRYFDAYGRMRYRLYRPPAPKPELIEPKQGFSSLQKSLWEPYSRGRKLGFSDLGTYNPASRLPSGRPSDHAVYPARAFDLGISPATGYDNAKARGYFKSLMGDEAVEYVILGDRIWSRARGLHAYTAGGHNNHVHVSGRVEL